MTKTSKTFERQKSRIAERPEGPFKDPSTEAMAERALSFLSLRDAVNRYPDTGESGDAYDSELAMVY
jgi:hypothetical protein